MPTQPNNSHLPFGDQRTAPWYGKDILSVKQFSREDLEYIFAVAHEMHNMVDHVGTFDLLKGKILANLFYEPSTRTSSSFTAAMERLGGSVIPINEVKYSSVSKGESLPDTVRTLECYADVIVIRHPEVGSAAQAAKAARKPVINAGDGIGEHPTQALLDAFTIREHLRRVRNDPAAGLDGLRVAIIGDIVHSRVARSNIWCLTKLGARVVLCGPSTLMPPFIENMGVDVTTDLREAIHDADVIYALRIQIERQKSCLFPSLRESIRLFRVDNESLQAAPKDALIMHPGPINRDIELAAEVADSTRSVILRQVTNGVAVRMAVMHLLVNSGRIAGE